MSQSAGNWIIAAGGAVMFCGLCLLPAALSDRHDSSTLAVAACLFSLGTLAMAGGLYFKARSLPAGGSAASGSHGKTPRRARGSCDACQADAAVIQCTVHRVHLCASCLGQHYDFRSCAYMPSTRRSGVRASRSAAMRAAKA